MYGSTSSQSGRPDNNEHMSAPISTAWVGHYKRNPRATIRLFCFPYAGGGASVFHGWSTRLGHEVEVCPIQLPGRENRISEPPLTKMGAVANLLTEALEPYLDGRVAFFGYSLGALVAYEVAVRLLAAKRVQPERLIVAAHGAPQIRGHREQTWQLPDPEFKKRLRRLNGTREEVLQNEELMTLMLPVIRADFQLAETYDFRADYARLDCSITVFGGTKDQHVSDAHLRAWMETTRGEFELKMFDGGHFFIQSHTQEVVDAVGNALRVHPQTRN
jgi:medium-chain acyl-[acyl-carrier-protein] hydrolase